MIPETPSPTPRAVPLLPRIAGALACAFGLLIIASWYFHWRVILQPVPASAPVQYNAALCFVLSGLGLFLLSARRLKLSAAFGLATALLGGLTTLEYFANLDLHIDLLLFKPYYSVSTLNFGRMSPITAFNFFLCGSAISCAALKPNWRRFMTSAGLLSCMVAVIAVASLVGYAFGINTARGWGAYSQMPIHTAIVFIPLGLGILLFVWLQVRTANFNFVRWLPVTASVTLMLMVAFVSNVNLSQLKKAGDWRRHTFEVILSAQAFEENFIDMQRGVRGFITLGDTNALASYESSLRKDPALFKQLMVLTRDNPAQQHRLADLAATMDSLFSYDERVIALCKLKGVATALQTDMNGESRRVFGNVRDVIKSFSEAERSLLLGRDSSEQTEFNHAEHLLIFGTVLAALLLVVANSMASRELGHRHRAESKLREITALQDAILDSANYAIIALEPDGLVRTFNPAAERMLGYSAAEVVGKTTPLLWRDPAEVAQQAEKLSGELGRAVHSGAEIWTTRSFRKKAEEYEVTYIRKDGSRFPVLVSLTALADEHGAVTGFLGVIADITERKRDQLALAKLQRHHQRILNSIGEGLHGLDLNGNIIFENPAAAAMLGWDAQELIGLSAHRIMHHTRADHSTYPVEECPIHATLHDGVERHVTDELFWRKDGSSFAVNYTCSAMRDETGALIGAMVSFRDITEAKKNQAALAESTERFRRSFDDAPIGMALVSLEGRWLKTNRALGEILDYSQEELLATDFQHITHPEDLAKDLACVRDIIAGHIPSYQMEKRYFRKDRSIVTVMLSVSAVRNAEKQPVYFVAQIENISDRKKHEAEREQLITELQSALAHIKTLSGMIPICGWCKNIRSDEGYWKTVEEYVRERSEVTFSHGICPSCSAKMNAEILKHGLKTDPVPKS